MALPPQNLQHNRISSVLQWSVPAEIIDANAVMEMSFDLWKKSFENIFRIQPLKHKNVWNRKKQCQKNKETSIKHEFQPRQGFHPVCNREYLIGQKTIYFAQSHMLTMALWITRLVKGMAGRPLGSDYWTCCVAQTHTHTHKINTHSPVLMLCQLSLASALQAKTTSSWHETSRWDGTSVCFTALERNIRPLHHSHFTLQSPAN